MSVLDRSSLEASPLADLHAIASELSIDGYRRLRKAELISRILEQHGAEDEASSAEAEPADREADEAGSGRRRRGRRGGRSRSARGEEAEDTAGPEEDDSPAASAADETAEDRAPARTAKGRGAERAAKGRDSERAADARDEQRPSGRRRREAADVSREEPTEDEVVEGVVELLPNGSGFVRVHPPDPSDDDVYISAAQVKRCDLVSGDRVTGPKRLARRSERFASLIRIDTINDQSVDELAEATRFDDLPSTFPTERLRFGSEDPTVKSIEWLTPVGRGSRVTIVGPARAGKTEALRRMASALATQEELTLSLALIGVRPEEIGEWEAGPVRPSVSVSFAQSSDAQAAAVELVVDQARRIAARGADAVVLIDSLDGLHPHAARRTMAAARNLSERGSVTIIATAAQPVGGETTVIALNVELTSSGRFPAIDLVASGTLRPELLVGEAAAEAIALARAEAIDAKE